MKKAQKNLLFMRAVPLAIAAAFAPSVWAQAALEEVVVTAQRRAERLQDIPLSITTITGADMEQRGMEGAASLRGAVPNLNMAPAPVSGLIGAVGMRGMSAGQPSIWQDPAVGIYVDGVFVGKNQGILSDLVDIDRLEVLRGPQGTLFGRNTQAGAINFVTRRPSGTFMGNVSVEMGDYGRHIERVSVDLPKADMLSVSVAARNEKQNGFITNDKGQSWGDKNRQGQRLALRLEPSKNTVIDYSYDRTDIDEGPQVGSLIASTGYLGGYAPSVQAANSFGFFQIGLPAAYGGTPANALGLNIKPYANPDYPTTLSGNGNLYQRLGLTGNTFSISHKLDGANSLKYIYGQRKMVYGDRGDYDQTPVNAFAGQRDTNYTTTSHEVQLTGSAAAMKYVAGIYLFSDDGTTLARQSGGFYSFMATYPMYKLTNFTVTSDAQAVFGQLDYDLSKQTTLTGGLRWTSEKKGVRAWRFNSNANFDPVTSTMDLSADQTFSAVTPNVALVHKIDANTNVFARVASGFKSGGYPAEAPVTALGGPTSPFLPERSTSYEVGTKMGLMGGKAQLNITGFVTKITDMQMSLLPPGSGSPTMVNAGQATTKGLEVEAQLRPTTGTRLYASYGYLDATLDQYNTFGPTGQVIDAASNTVMPGAPKNTLNLGADVLLGTTSLGSLRGIVDMRYVSTRYTYAAQIDPMAANAAIGNSAAESTMPALTTVNARLLLSDVNVGGPGTGSVSLWVKNMFDERQLVAHMDVGGFYQVGYWSDPRTIGVNFNYRW